MLQVMVSPKYQIVIPKEIRNSFGIKPGQKLSCIAKSGVIHYLPDRPIEEMRGFIKVKFDWKKGLREKKDRF